MCIRDSFRGAGGVRQLEAGRWFELSQHPRHDTGGEAERQFLVLGVIVHAENALPVSAHLNALPGSLKPQIDAAKRAQGLEDDQNEAANDYRHTGTGHFLVELEAQRRTQPYRSPLRHQRPVMGGPQTATVVGPEGEEIHTDALNRVRVQFHWDRQGQHNEQAGVWPGTSSAARTASASCCVSPSSISSLPCWKSCWWQAFYWWCST